MKDEKNKMISWQDKRINEINKICSAQPAAADGFIDEVYAIYYPKQRQTLMMSLLQSKKKKKAKYMPQLIEEWRNLK